MPLEHLQSLLEGCRPHQHRERAALQLLCHYSSLQARVIDPLDKLLELGGCLGQAREAQPPGPGQTGGRRSPPPPASSEQAAAQEDCLMLQLSTCHPSGSGLLTYGDAADGALAAVAGVEWAPFLTLAAVGGPEGLSLQQELADGAVSAEAVNSMPLGVPVVLAVPRCQLQSASPAAAAAAAEGGATPVGSWLTAPEQQQERQEEVWVCGRVVEVLGKRLRTALDFTHPEQQAVSQRVSMAVVRVPALLSTAHSGCAQWEGPPPVLDLLMPCHLMWRLAGPSAEVLGNGCSSGTSSRVGAVLPPPAQLGLWQFQGYCSAQGVLTACAEAALKASASRAGKEQQQQEEEEALPEQGVCQENPQVLVVRLRHLELLVLAQLSGDPALQEACRTADPARHVAACWAAAAHQVAIGGGGSSGGEGGGGGAPHAVLICAATAEAVAQALCYGWSPKKLGWVLRCTRQQAAEVSHSFLQAFPSLQHWCAALAERAGGAGAAATLAGRHRSLTLPAKPDAMVSRGLLKFACCLLGPMLSYARRLPCARLVADGGLLSFSTTPAWFP